MIRFFIKTVNANVARIRIADLSKNPPAQVKYWENWGQDALLDGWHD